MLAIGLGSPVDLEQGLVELGSAIEDWDVFYEDFMPDEDAGGGLFAGEGLRRPRVNSGQGTEKEKANAKERKRQ
jgi:hypothetical protein